MYDVRRTMYDLAKPWTRLRIIRHLSNQPLCMIFPTTFAYAPQFREPEARQISKS